MQKTIFMALVSAVVSVLGFERAALADPPATPELQLEASSNPNKAAVGVATDSAGNVISIYTTPTGAVNADSNTKTEMLWCVRSTAAGVQIGRPFLIDDRAYRYSRAMVASDASGNFTVVWDHFAIGLLGYTSLRGRRFDASGAPRSLVFDISATGGTNPQIAMNATGDAVISWSNFTSRQVGIGFGSYTVGFHEIRAQRYAGNGLRRGAQIEVRRNPYDTRRYPQGYLYNETVAINSAGAFALTWGESVLDNVGGPGIMARLYGADGKALDDGFVVEPGVTVPAGRHGLGSSDIGIDDAGNVLVTWNDYGIVGRRYSGAGVALGPKFPISTFDDDSNQGGEVIMNPSGEALVVWHAIRAIHFQIGVFGNFQAQRLDASGAKVGSAFIVNTTTRDLLTSFDGVPDGRGGYVLSWILATGPTDTEADPPPNGDLYAAHCCTAQP